MKKTLTLFALAFTGVAQAQRSSDPQRLLEAIHRQTNHLPKGVDKVLQEQTRQGQSKTASGFYRITGWSRYNLSTSAFQDSAVYRYSGNRASGFADERENMNAGTWYFLSKADYSANSVDGGATNRSEVESSYDAADRKTGVVFRDPNWSSKSTMTYDAAGRELGTTEFDSANGSWMAVRRFQHTYNSAGLLSSTLIVELPGGSPEGRVLHFYNAAGKEDSMSVSMWTPAGYFEVSRTITAWSGTGEQLSVTNYHVDENLSMEPFDRTEFSYDASSMLSTSTSLAFINGAWANQMKDSFGYTGTKPLYTFKRSSMWNDAASAWEDIREWSYSLDAQNRWRTETFSTPGLGGGPEPQTKTEFTYNSTGLITKTETFLYDRSQQHYLSAPQERELFHYDLTAPASVGGHAKTAGIHVWPNPAMSILNIDCGAAGISTAEIYSATGQRMPSPQAGNKRVDVSQLPPGIYFLRVLLKAEDAPAQVRFVKL